MRETLQDEYFTWLCHFVGCRRHQALLRHLHEIEFRYYMPMDGNRFEDGVNLRYRFADEKGHHYRYITAWLDNRNCTVLEMMVALAIRIEDTIMSDPEFGDRTSRWFVEMLKSMDIYKLDDEHYNRAMVDIAVQNMLDHNYSRNGEGGLFHLPHTRKDLRKVEIWCQAMWYLDSIIN
jgi:hypothetical protein